MKAPQQLLLGLVPGWLFELAASVQLKALSEHPWLQELPPGPPQPFVQELYCWEQPEPGARQSISWRVQVESHE